MLRYRAYIHNESVGRNCPDDPSRAARRVAGTGPIDRPIPGARKHGRLAPAEAEDAAPVDRRRYAGLHPRKDYKLGDRIPVVIDGQRLDPIVVDDILP